MPRQTLPEIDPLAMLGIGTTKPDERPVTGRRPPAARMLTERIPPEPKATTTQEMPSERPEAAVEQPKPQARGRAQLSIAASAVAPPRPLKARVNGRISAELWEEVRDCVVWHGHRMTIDRFTEEAFREHLARLRKDHKLGARFPARDQDPKQGRRVS